MPFWIGYCFTDSARICDSFIFHRSVPGCRWPSMSRASSRGGFITSTTSFQQIERRRPDVGLFVAEEDLLQQLDLLVGDVDELPRRRAAVVLAGRLARTGTCRRGR